MAGIDRAFSFLTYALWPEHVDVLRDWLEFFDVLPWRLIVWFGQDPAVEPAVRAVCWDYGIELLSLGDAAPHALQYVVSPYLTRQFRAAGDDLVCLARPDTLPFRRPGVRWQAEALEQMARSGALFLTGATRSYRADRPTADPRFAVTDRVSHNFLMMEAPRWRAVQAGRSGRSVGTDRFAQEAVLERHCAETGDFGLRLLNGEDLRILQTLDWTPGIGRTRRSFRAGRGVAPYIHGFEDDYEDLGSRFYMYRQYSLMTRMRIELGRMRRSVVARARTRSEA